MNEINTKKELIEDIKKRMEGGEAYLIVGLKNPKVYTLHNLDSIKHGGKYYASVRHLGFGCFEGRTENGKFDFCGGGAMVRYDFDGKFISYTHLNGSEEILQDLGYDFDRMLEGLTEELNSL